MSPLYDYRCPDGHVTEELRRYNDRDLPTACHCGGLGSRILSAHHRQPDGIYSYAPNLGSEEAFERKRGNT